MELTLKAKDLCLNYTDNRCKYVEHNLYNNKKINKCMPKEVNLSENYIKDEQTCKMLDNQFIGEPGNKKCININAKCNDIKHGSLCNKLSNRCYWTPTGSNPNDDFERGYCQDVDILDLEKIIDDYHTYEISKQANTNELIDNYNNLEKDLQYHMINL